MTNRRQPVVPESGMSLTEALVAILLLTMIMVAFLGLLDSSSRMAKVQGDVADSTENVRFAMASIVRMARMAGTGGVPLVFDGKDDDGNPVIKELAISFEDNMPENTLVGGKLTWGGSDLLRIRGAIISELWDIDGEQHVDFGNNTLTIPLQSPVPGVSTLQDLGNYPTNPDKRSIILIKNISVTVPPTGPTAGGFVRRIADYRIVQFPEGGSINDSDPNKLVVPFSTVDDGTPDSPIKNNPSGVWIEPEKGPLVHAGFMEQAEFFIGKNEAGLPSLYRFMGAGTADEMVPNIVDLQVAYGCDMNMDGDLAANEWYLSSANGTTPKGPELFFLRELRISVVSRSQSPDLKWSEKATPPENGTLAYDIDHRHRILTVRVTLRAHPRPQGA